MNSSQSTSDAQPEPDPGPLKCPEAAHPRPTRNAMIQSKKSYDYDLKRRYVYLCNSADACAGYVDRPYGCPESSPSSSVGQSCPSTISTTPATPAKGRTEMASHDVESKYMQHTDPERLNKDLGDDLAIPELVDAAGSEGNGPNTSETCRAEIPLDREMDVTESSNDTKAEKNTDGDTNINATEGHQTETPSDKMVIVSEPGEPVKGISEESQPDAPAETESDPVTSSDEPKSEGISDKVKSEDTSDEIKFKDSPDEARPPDTTEQQPPPHENIVDLINRKRAERIAARRAAEEREASRKRELAANPPPPPESPALTPKPNRNTDFTTEPPWHFSLGTRPPARFYKRAHVLTVHWSLMSKGPPTAVKEMTTVMKRSYGYEFSHCALPAHPDAPRILAQALTDVMEKYEYGGKETLIILHYMGPSLTNESSFRICPPAWPCCPASVEVDLHALLCDTLFAEAFAPDVLCLLDCAYAMENCGSPRAGKEILAASTEPSRFTLRDRSITHTFTRNITEYLQHATITVQFYTDELERKLVAAAEPRVLHYPSLRAWLGDPDAEKRRKMTLPRTKKVAGLRTGMGPPARYIYLAPLTTSWTFWLYVNEMKEKPARWILGEVNAWCSVCGKLSWLGTIAHKGIKCICNNAKGHTYEVVDEDVELRELIRMSWR